MVPLAMVKTYQSNEIGSVGRFITRLTFCLTGFVGLVAWSVASAQQPQANPAARQAVPQAGDQAAAPIQRPFPPLPAAEQKKLQSVLMAWQNQSQGTNTLACNFERWHFDLLAAPAGIHAHKAEGEIKYAKPDKGLFRVDSVMYYKGMKEGKPQFGPIANKFGEHWVCNGVELIEYDRGNLQCNIQVLPQNMQGKQIFNSPLPFVFNLDAARIQQRYWIKLEEEPAPNVIMLSAWPKLQEDRAQYKVVQIALNSNYEPIMLRMYAPNFHPKLAPQWDQYEFSNVKRNAIGAGIQQFMGNFIPEKPPANWKITRENFTPPKIAQAQPAGQAAPNRQ
jgi:TIGR03009 family protein